MCLMSDASSDKIPTGRPVISVVNRIADYAPQMTELAQISAHDPELAGMTALKQRRLWRPPYANLAWTALPRGVCDNRHCLRIIQRASDGPTIGLRADMDAACPIPGKTGTGLCQHPTAGKMHACGHGRAITTIAAWRGEIPGGNAQYSQGASR